MAAKANMLSVQVSDDIRAGLERLADERHVAKEKIVSEALARYIDDETDYAHEIDQALKEAETGVFVSGDKVLEWIKSWGTDGELPMPEPDIFPEGKR